MPTYVIDEQALFDAALASLESSREPEQEWQGPVYEPVTLTRGFVERIQSDYDETFGRPMTVKVTVCMEMTHQNVCNLERMMENHIMVQIKEEDR